MIVVRECSEFVSNENQFEEECLSDFLISQPSTDDCPSQGFQFSRFSALMIRTRRMRARVMNVRTYYVYLGRRSRDRCSFITRTLTINNGPVLSQRAARAFLRD